MDKVKKYIFSLMISFLITALLLCLSATIFAYTNINDNYLQTFVFGVIMISVLVSSTVLAKKIKEKGILNRSNIWFCICFNCFFYYFFSI